jgi:hypothetical protein
MADNIIIKSSGTQILTIEKNTMETRAEFINRRRDGQIQKNCIISRIIETERKLESLQNETDLTVEIFSQVNENNVIFEVDSTEEYKVSLNEDGTVLLERITFNGQII